MAKVETKMVFLPIDQQNPKLLTETVYYNGQSYQIKLGEPVEVPEPIWEILHVAGKA